MWPDGTPESARHSSAVPTEHRFEVAESIDAPERLAGYIASNPVPSTGAKINASFNRVSQW